MKELIIKAYLLSSKGYSADRVIADPGMNSDFIERCRQLGLTNSETDLNRSLINIRKAGGFTGLRRSKETTFNDISEYQFASEIAVRFLERRDQVTLDDILCEPTLRNDFDLLATELAPGYAVLKYRWAALNIRKSRKLRPEILARVIKPVLIRRFRVGIDDILNQLPREQGLYLFFTKLQTLYIGETENFLLRIKKHLEHSDNKGLARWIWANESNEELFLEIQTLDNEVSTRIRRALESELIQSRKPLFNIST